MSYRTLTAKAADEVAALLLAKGGDDPTDADVNEADHVQIIDAFDCNEGAIESASQQARAEWVAHPASRKPSEADRYRLEARMAAHLHATLCAVDVGVRSDMGFWRHLALFPYRWYLVAREHPIKPQDYGGTRPDPENEHKRLGTDPKYQLLLRTFLWGKAAYDPDDAVNPYRRTTVVGESGGAEIDVWHSHMIRTQLGHLGRIGHHFIDSICADPKANDRDGGRDVEKRLTRMKHNVLLDVYGDDGRELVDAQKAMYLAERPQPK